MSSIEIQKIQCGAIIVDGKDVYKNFSSIEQRVEHYLDTNDLKFGDTFEFEVYDEKTLPLEDRKEIIEHSIQKIKRLITKIELLNYNM